MDPTEDIVRQAVRALYSWDAAQQAEANRWLSEFQNSEQAWQTACALVNPNEPSEIQIFAAGLLSRKVRAEWSRTDPALRAVLRRRFR